VSLKNGLSQLRHGLDPFVNLSGFRSVLEQNPETTAVKLQPIAQ
jgi:hypothetical protein